MRKSAARVTMQPSSRVQVLASASGRPCSDLFLIFFDPRSGGGVVCHSLNIDQRGGLVDHRAGKVDVLDQLIAASPFFFEARPCRFLQVAALGGTTVIGLVWVDAPARIFGAGFFVFWKLDEFSWEGRTYPVGCPGKQHDRFFACGG